MTDLAERYGRQRSSGAPRRWLPWAVAGGFVVAVVAFWAFTYGMNATVETQTVGYRVTSPTTIELDGRISAAPNTPLVCTVEAQNDRSMVVGWKVVEVPPVNETHQLLQVRLQTTQPADVANVRTCRMVD